MKVGRIRKRLARILAEPVEIICTNGTVSPYRLEELLAPYEEHELYVFVDADEDGEKIRVLFKRSSLQQFIYIQKRFTGKWRQRHIKVLATILQGANFKSHDRIFTLKDVELNGNMDT